MYRSLIISISITLAGTAAAATKANLWSTTSNLEKPESVYFDAESNKIFVSNIAGGGGDKDSNGWIATITFDKQGKPVVTKLLDGLNAPKGIRVQNGFLWVTDIDEVLKVNVATGKLIERISIAGAQFLNDLAIGANGDVYVSDMLASKIYVIENGKPEIFAEGDVLTSPNGLLVQNGRLIVAAWGLITDVATRGVKVPGHLYSIDLTTKAQTQITKQPLGNLDGLEMTTAGDYIVSDWVAGKVYRVSKDGIPTLITDGIKNAADIGLKGDTLLIPAMSANEVSAVKL